MALGSEVGKRITSTLLSLLPDCGRNVIGLPRAPASNLPATMDPQTEPG